MEEEGRKKEGGGVGEVWGWWEGGEGGQGGGGVKVCAGGVKIPNEKGVVAETS